MKTKSIEELKKLYPALWKKACNMAKDYRIREQILRSLASVEEAKRRDRRLQERLGHLADLACREAIRFWIQRHLSEMKKLIAEIPEEMTVKDGKLTIEVKKLLGEMVPAPADATAYRDQGQHPIRRIPGASMDEVGANPLTRSSQ